MRRCIHYLPSPPVRERDEEDFIRDIMLSYQIDEIKRSLDTSPHPHCENETGVCVAPSPPVRERDEDFIRNIMLPCQIDEIKSSLDTSPQAQCENETGVCDSIKPPDRENSVTAMRVESEHIIAPPSAFCSVEKLCIGHQSACVSQSPGGNSVECNQEGCPVASAPPADGLGVAQADTNCNADVGQLTETVETSSEIDSTEDGSADYNAVYSDSSCSEISGRRSSLIHTEGRTETTLATNETTDSDKNPLTEGDTTAFSCGLSPLSLANRNTACEFVAGKCSPKETEQRVKEGKEDNKGIDESNEMTAKGAEAENNAIISSCFASPTDSLSLTLSSDYLDCVSITDRIFGCMAGDVGGRSDSEINFDDISISLSVSVQQSHCSVLSEGSSLTLGYSSTDDETAMDNSAEPETTIQREKCDNDEVNAATGELVTKESNNLIDNSCTVPSIQKSPEGILDKDHDHAVDDCVEQRIKEGKEDNTGIAESNEVTAKEAEAENNTIISSCFTSPRDTLPLMLSSDYLDCCSITDRNFGCTTGDAGKQSDSEINFGDRVESISLSVGDKQSRVSVPSEGSSLTLCDPSTDDEPVLDDSVEPESTIQEDCEKKMPYAADAYGHETGTCWKDDTLKDDPQAGKCLSDVNNEVNKTGNEENNGNLDTVSWDFQGEEGILNTGDDAISNNKVDDDNLSDASSLSELLSAVQSFSDSEDDASTSADGSAKSGQPFEQARRAKYVDACDNQLAGTLAVLREMNIGNTDSAGIDVKRISMNVEATSLTIGQSVPASETPFTEAHDAQQAQVADLVPSTASWMTESTSSSSELSVDAKILSLSLASTLNSLENRQEEVEICPKNNESVPDAAACESCSAKPTALPAEAKSPSHVTTGAKSRVENSEQHTESSSGNPESMIDTTSDENYTARSSELPAHGNVSCTVAAGSQSKQEVNVEQGKSYPDNAERIGDTAVVENHTKSSSELPVDGKISCTVSAGSQSKEEVNVGCGESSSDNVERIGDSATVEIYTKRSSELPVDANISCTVAAGSQSKEQVTEEHVESSLYSVEHNRDTATYRSHFIPSSNLPVQAKNSSLPTHGEGDKVENILKPLENSSNGTECTRATAASKSYTVPSPEVPVEATISSVAIVSAQYTVDIGEQHVGSSSDCAEGIRHTTACDSQTLANDAASRSHEDGACESVNEEEISGEIPSAEASASWETLSDHNWATEDESADNNRGEGATVTTPPQRRRRRRRRESQWRQSRQEELGLSVGLEEITSPEAEVRLNEALSHSEREMPLLLALSAGTRLASVGSAGAAEPELLVAALAGVTLADADAHAEDATDILYGTRDLHSAAVDAAVACVVDSELQRLSTLYAQRLGGCLLLTEDTEADPEAQPQPQPQDPSTSQAEGEARRPLQDSSPPAAPPTPPSPPTPPPPPPPAAPAAEAAPTRCCLHG